MENLINRIETLQLNSPLTDPQGRNPISNQDNILSATNKPNSFTMSEKFNADYIKCVPEFDGNPNELARYLSVSESLLTHFYNKENPGCFQNIYLLNSLISKLKGNARVVINVQTVNSWNDLKLILTRNFADQRDETCLNRDLVMLRQNGNENPQQFYDRCLHLLNLLCSYVDIHEHTEDAKNIKRDLYQNLTLKTFLSGLKEPLGTTIRCMKPSNLSQALQFVLHEENVQYFQKFSYKSTTMSHSQGKQQIQPKCNFPQNSFSNSNRPQYFPNQNRFQVQPVQQPMVNNQFNKFPFNTPTFRKPVNNTTNVFKPNQNKQFTKSTPMSISTRNTFRNANAAQASAPTRNVNNLASNSFFQRTAQPKNFVSEELFNTETNETDYYDVNTDNGQDNEQYLENSEQYNDHEYYFESVNAEQEQNFPEPPQTNENT